MTEQNDATETDAPMNIFRNSLDQYSVRALRQMRTQLRYIVRDLKAEGLRLNRLLERYSLDGSVATDTTRDRVSLQLGSLRREYAFESERLRIIEEVIGKRCPQDAILVRIRQRQSEIAESDQTLGNLIARLGGLAGDGDASERAKVKSMADAEMKRLSALRLDLEALHRESAAAAKKGRLIAAAHRLRVHVSETPAALGASTRLAGKRRRPRRAASGDKDLANVVLGLEKEMARLKQMLREAMDARETQ